MEGGRRGCYSRLAGSVGHLLLFIPKTRCLTFFSLTDNDQARRRKINEVICISKEPYADLQREGFNNAPDLETTTFTIASDTEGNLLRIFSQVCDAIDRAISEKECVLVWDVGGGVAALAAYSKYRVRDVL